MNVVPNEDESHFVLTAAAGAFFPVTFLTHVEMNEVCVSQCKRREHMRSASNSHAMLRHVIINVCFLYSFYALVDPR